MYIAGRMEIHYFINGARVEPPIAHQKADDKRPNEYLRARYIDKTEPFETMEDIQKSIFARINFCERHKVNRPQDIVKKLRK